jgi:DNA-binding transcriptional ArsR family regulator
MESLDNQAELFKALAHPTRLHILEALAREEACVCHLTTLLQQRQANVSQHLMVLREVGLVQDRKDGVLVYYRLADQRVIEAVRLLRDVLHGSGKSAQTPDIPTGPLADCPCPQCQNGVCSVK